MNNELVKITTSLQQCSKKDIAKQVMSVCRAITPQFYKNTSLEDAKAERLSVELLTADIDNEVLANMCQRAVLNYPKARSENPKAYFDINYILQFYKDAFNFIHCENIKLSKNAQKVSDYYDRVKGILYQKWLDEGEEKTIAIIQEERDGHQYSPKDYERLFTNLDELDWGIPDEDSES